MNIALDIFLIKIIGMGVEGAALATIILQIVSGIISGTYVIVNYKEFMPNLRHDLPDRVMVSEMMATEVAMSLMYSIVDIGSVIFQGTVNTLGAAVMVPAYGYSGVCWNTPLTWTVMTVFILVVYFVNTQRIFKSRLVCQVIKKHVLFITTFSSRSSVNPCCILFRMV